MSILQSHSKTRLSLKTRMARHNDVTMVAGAYDVLSALVAEKAGYDAIWASSLGIATTYGHLDDDRYTMSDVLSATAAMARVTRLPVIADVGAGYYRNGDAGPIVRAFEGAGAAGICMEETAFPRRNSLYEQVRKLTPVDQFAQRLSVAIAARSAPDFLVLARVEAMIAGMSPHQTMRRAVAYEEAGVDAVVIHSTSPTHDEVQQVATLWRGSVPLVLIPTTYSSLPIDTFRRIPQVGMLIYANQSIRSAMVAMEQTLRQIKADGHGGRMEQAIAPVKDLLDLQTRFGERT